jgi:molecular chaperone DnaK
MSGKRVYGIDLGTTYSCIAHVDEHGKPVVLQNAEGNMTTPSVVFFESKDNVVVGQAAQEVVSIHTDLCVSTVKRVMGDPHWEREFYGHLYKPQDISSFILRKVVGDAEKITGEKIEEVVITCPAYFGVNEKEATKQAGILAGLNVLYVIPEPTAAALAYGIEQDQDQVILVYDLGGGTFDITLIEIKDREINVICTGGDHQLGGKDWDDAIVSYFTQRFEESTGTSADALLEDQDTYQELLTAAERCKKMLSSRQSVVEAVRFGGERVKVDLTRETFDRITAQYLERTLSLADQELEKARERGYVKIHKLLLVGGSTYMPQVLETVKKKFPFEVLQYDPNQAIAKGAALFGYKFYLDEQINIRLGGEPDIASQAVIESAHRAVALEHGLALPGLKSIVNKKIVNVSSKSFGVVVMNRQNQEVVSNIIEINDAVPRTITKQFGTHADDQLQIDLRCMENKHRGLQEVDLSACTLVGEAVLAFARPLPRSSPIEITFDLSPDGLLTIKARDLATGGKIDAQFKTESIMSHEELEAAKSRNLSIHVA